MLRSLLLATTCLLCFGAQAKSFVVIHLDDVARSHFDAAMTRTMAVTANRTVYDRAIMNVPLCGPARAAFLTGQDAETTGIRSNDPANWGTGFVPQALVEAGYRTQMFGKMPNGYQGTPAELGFQRWAVLTEISGDRYFDVELNVNGVLRATDGYVTDDLYRRARNCVEGSRPFFCWVAAVGAHAPAEAAPRHAGGCDNVPFRPGPAFNEADVSDKPQRIRSLPLYDTNKAAKAAENWRDQCATLLADDEGVRSILDMIDNDVCVILTSDNGRLNGQHRLEGKSELYEESIRVPLVTWNCGGVGGGDDRLVSNVDIPAHILSLAAVAPLRQLDGRPLDGEERVRVRIVGGTDVPAEGWRRKNTVQWTFTNGETEYYDLRSDPYQESNIVPPPKRNRK